MILATVPSGYGAAVPATVWRAIGSETIGADGSLTVEVGGFADQAAAFDGGSQPLVTMSVQIPASAFPELGSIVASIESAVVLQQGPLQGATVQANPAS